MHTPFLYYLSQRQPLKITQNLQHLSLCLDSGKIPVVLIEMTHVTNQKAEVINTSLVDGTNFSLNSLEGDLNQNSPLL